MIFAVSLSFAEVGRLVSKSGRPSGAAFKYTGLVSLTVCFFALVAGPAAAQRHWGPDQIPYCASETPSMTCEDESLSALLAKLDMPTAEALTSQGYVGVRLFRYDAFGTIWPAVSFISKPVDEYRREGRAEARTIQGDGHVSVISRPTWESGWLEVAGLIEALRDRAEPEPEPEPDMATIIAQKRMPRALRCIDPPSLIVEVLRDGEVQRWWPLACDRDPWTAKALVVADIVAAAFPTCGHLPIERYGRGIGRLRACLMIGGDDPMAALAVMELLKVDIGGDTHVAYEPDRQAANVSLLAIDGRRFEGRDAVVGAMREQALGSRWLRILRAEGDSDGVLVTAQLAAVNMPNRPDPITVLLRWSKHADGQWRIASWEVEQRPGVVS